MTPTPAPSAPAAPRMVPPPSTLQHVVRGLMVTVSGAPRSRTLWPDAHIDLVIHAAPPSGRHFPVIHSPGLQWLPARAPVLPGPALRVRLVPWLLPQVTAWLADPPEALTPVLAALAIEDAPGAAEAMFAWLSSAVHEQEPGPVAVAASVLLAAPGRVHMAALIDWAQTSERDLQRQCRQQLGCTLTGLQRLIRFERTLMALAVLATDMGFADQAHLSREIRRFTGRSPLALWRDVRVPDGVPETFKTSARSSVILNP